MTGGLRPDPLAGVWERELEPMLRRQPKLQPITLFTHLQQHTRGVWALNPANFTKTSQSVASDTRTTAEVMFPQEHQPGEMGLSDFTQLASRDYHCWQAVCSPALSLPPSLQWLAVCASSSGRRESLPCRKDCKMPWSDLEVLHSSTRVIASCGLPQPGRPRKI